ncbi:MAG: Nif11-like leader peptide family natural product precursor [Spirochaetales bacterium]|nr:Nif11-like leader peptide family natural product precursor [Spirochaetales bacterium]
MSTKNVEEFLIAGGEDKDLKLKFDVMDNMELFVEEANKDGYDFTIDEFKQVLKESGDSFESFGNPRKKAIWWK